MLKKACDKIHHPFNISTLSKVGVEGAYLNILKAICKNPTANIILNGQKLKALPLTFFIPFLCFFTCFIEGIFSSHTCCVL